MSLVYKLFVWCSLHFYNEISYMTLNVLRVQISYYLTILSYLSLSFFTTALTNKYKFPHYPTGQIQVLSKANFKYSFGFRQPKQQLPSMPRDTILKCFESLAVH